MLEMSDGDGKKRFGKSEGFDQVIWALGVSFAATGRATRARIPRSLDDNIALATGMCEKHVAALLNLFGPTTLAANNQKFGLMKCSASK